jgi:hypothetical protein
MDESIASLMLSGELCEQCSAPIGEPVGYPRLCEDCASGDHIDDMAADKRRRADNREHGFNALADSGYVFEVKNGAAHLIVETEAGKIDFWPGTRKWIVRATRQNGYGVEALKAAFKPAGQAATRPIYPVAAEVTDHYSIVWKPHMSEFTIAAYEAAGYTITGKP